MFVHSLFCNALEVICHEDGEYSMKMAICTAIQT